MPNFRYSIGFLEPNRGTWEGMTDDGVSQADPETPAGLNVYKQMIPGPSNRIWRVMVGREGGESYRTYFFYNGKQWHNTEDMFMSAFSTPCYEEALGLIRRVAEIKLNPAVARESMNKLLLIKLPKNTDTKTRRAFEGWQWNVGHELNQNWHSENYDEIKRIADRQVIFVTRMLEKMKA